MIILAGCARNEQRAVTASVPRIVSLAPSVTEMICAIGAEKTLVGRTSACDYPPEIVKNVPVVGGFGKPALEALFRVQPTLVIDVDLEDEAIIESLKRAGIEHQRVRCSRVDDIPAAIRKVGALAGMEQPANELAERLAGKIADMRLAAQKAQATGAPPTVFAEIWSDPLMTAGSGSLIAELVTLAGGKNIADEIAKDYFHVSSEWVVARDPDIIVCFDPADAKTVAARAGWANVKAVRTGRIYSRLDNNLIERPGPRVLEGIAVLRDCILGGRTP